MSPSRSVVRGLLEPSSFVLAPSAFLLLLALSPALPALGEDPRPRVSVAVELAEPDYRLHFGPVGIAEVESALAAHLAAKLAAEVGFLTFSVAVPDPPATDATRLTLTIGEATAGSLRPVDLSARLEGPRVAGLPAPLRLPFRPIEKAIETPGPPAAFVAEARRALTSAKRKAWVDGLFFAVVVTEEAHAFESGGSWFWCATASASSRSTGDAPGGDSPSPRS